MTKSSRRPEILPDNLKLPPKTKLGGYLYLIGFTDGQVKVGATRCPHDRVAAHRQSAELAGTGISAIWFSERHQAHYANETALIDLLSSVGGPSIGREWFTGVEHSQAVELATSLDYQPVDEAADAAYVDPDVAFRARLLDRWKGREDEVFDAIASERPRSSSEPPPGLQGGLAATVASLFGGTPAGDYDIAKPSGESVPIAVFEEIARLSGRHVEEVLDMDYIDVIEENILETVRLQARYLRCFAVENGRVDLLRTYREVVDYDESDEGGAR